MNKNSFTILGRGLILQAMVEQLDLLGFKFIGTADWENASFITSNHISSKNEEEYKQLILGIDRDAYDQTNVTFKLPDDFNSALYFAKESLEEIHRATIYFVGNHVAYRENHIGKILSVGDGNYDYFGIDCYGRAQMNSTICNAKSDRPATNEEIVRMYSQIMIDEYPKGTVIKSLKDEELIEAVSFEDPTELNIEITTINEEVLVQAWVNGVCLFDGYKWAEKLTHLELISPVPGCDDQIMFDRHYQEVWFVESDIKIPFSVFSKVAKHLPYDETE